MLHYFSGEVKNIGGDRFLINDSFGIQVLYGGKLGKGDFFVYPYFDDQKKTILYLAFDEYDQRRVFENLLKVSGVGAKTAFQIVQFPLVEIQEAIDNLDAKFFQIIPGIGPKLAKKIVLELKGNFKLSEVLGVEQDQKLFKAITKSLQGFGFDGNRVKELLRSYPEKLTEENLPMVAKWIIGEMGK